MVLYKMLVKSMILVIKKAPLTLYKKAYLVWQSWRKLKASKSRGDLDLYCMPNYLIAEMADWHGNNSTKRSNLT